MAFSKQTYSYFSNVSSYTPKSSWKTPKGPRNFEVFSNLSGDGNFKIANSKLGYFNFSREEWQTMRALVDDKRTIIKKAEKGSSTFLQLKNNQVMIRIIEMCHLMKRLYRISQEQVIDVFKMLSPKIQLVIKSLNILLMNLKQLLIWLSYIFQS